MARDDIKKTGTVNMYKNDRGGATLVTEPVLGIVKNNVDPTRSGRIDVYVASFGGSDPDDSESWVKGVRYLSPFSGIASPNNDPADGPDKTGYGKFVGNPQSYGFWASAPDIGTQVVCIFVDGRIDQGYYIGCVPQVGLLQMTPAVAASSKVVPNASEGESYGGADRLPTSEVNLSNPAIAKSPQIYNEPKPIHSYQTAILNQQGLIRDNVRGVIGSSAQRETPSRVFGISTPGGPIFEGGYTNSTIKAAAKTADPTKLKQLGRTGGHSIVMDDGDLEGRDQLMRFRTSGGHQIMMSDSGQTLFIIHSNGQSWVELGAEGTVDIYSTNSFNVRTQGDINFHADRNININAAKDLNIFGENINIESSKAYNQRVGTNFSGYTMGQFTVKVDGAMSHFASGQASYASSSVTFINGSKVNLNSGSAGLSPQTVPVLPKTSHIDTINSPTVGWMNPSPNPLVSVTNRAPAHQPWVGSGKGVDVKVSSTAPSQAPTPTDTVVASTPPTPQAPVTPSQVTAAPQIPAATSVIPAPVTQALVAQTAATAQAAGAVTNKVNGVIGQASGVTAKIAEGGGTLKPGSAEQVTALMNKGMDSAKAMVGAVTGVGGATSPAALLNNVTAQANAVASNINAAVNVLQKSGALTANTSTAAAAGLAMAAASAGAGPVVDALKTGKLDQSLLNNVAAGKFAAGVSDGMSFSGLKTSLGGLADGLKGKIGSIGSGIGGLGNSISSLTAGLKSGLQAAFSSVESSFGKLKAGVPNTLGNAGQQVNTPAEASEVVKSSNEYDVATAEVDSAEDAFFAAKRNYRNENTPESYAKLQAAEAALSSAKQKQAQASASFLQSNVGGAAAASIASTASQLASGLTTQATALTTTLTSGLNALPGGPAVVQAITDVTKSTNPITSIAGNVGNTLNNAKNQLSGDLIGNTNKLVSATLGKVGGLSGNLAGGLGNLTSKLKAGSSGLMGQLQASLSAITGTSGEIKLPVAATGTFDTAALAAKTGELLGNPKIPAPVFTPQPQSFTPDENSAKITEALNKVIEAQAEEKRQKRLVEQLVATEKENPNPQFWVTYEKEWTKYEELMAKTAKAQTAYELVSRG